MDSIYLVVRVLVCCVLAKQCCSKTNITFCWHKDSRWSLFVKGNRHHVINVLFLSPPLEICIVPSSCFLSLMQNLWFKVAATGSSVQSHPVVNNNELLCLKAMLVFDAHFPCYVHKQDSVNTAVRGLWCNVHELLLLQCWIRFKMEIVS